MPFPHPQPCNDHHRQCDISNDRCVVRKFLKRTVDISDYRDGEYDMYPANDETLGRCADHIALQYTLTVNGEW